MKKKLSLYAICHSIWMKLKRKKFMLPIVILWDYRNYVRARSALKKLIADKNDDEIYLVLSNGFGDPLYGLSLLDALIDKYPDKKFIIICNSAKEKIFRTFCRDNKVILRLTSPNDETRKRLIHQTKYWNAAKEALSHGIFIMHLNLAWLSIINSNTSLMSKFREVLDIPEEAPIKYHDLKKVVITSIPDFEKNKQKIVILNPYSSTMYTRMPLYEALCDELLRRGYLVYTNVIEDQEVIRGSQPLKCDFCEFYSIVSEISLVVSIRSGILDLAVPSGVNMFVVYEYLSGFHNLYELGAWKCTGKIKSVVVREDNDIQGILDKFSRFLDELKAEGRIS